MCLAVSGKQGDQTMDPTATPDLATQVTDAMTAAGNATTAVNFTWVLVAAFLVMFMQAGFALVETGLTRSKNVAHTMAMNFMIYPLGMLGFYVAGFAIMFGGFGALGTMGS